MHKLFPSKSVLCFLILLLPNMVFGEIVHETRSVRQGAFALIEEANCIYEPPGRNVGTTLLRDRKPMQLLFKPDPLQKGTVVLYLETGDELADDKLQCTRAVARKYIVTIDDVEQVSDNTTSTVFKVLVSALVLAILLESAFELLFNWRLFQEFFVGKAWRTPIMFAISLVVVTRFGIDVLGPVVDAYGGKPAGTTPGGTLTSILSAMIVAGGSVGVNRLMKKLGIRSPFPQVDEERAMVNDTEAYVSITVLKEGSERTFAVNLSEATPDPDVPAILGVVGTARRSSLASLFFPTKQRIPRSGGLRIAVNKTYRFSVTDLQTGYLYNLAGIKIDKQSEAPTMRFAARAFVDLVVVLKEVQPTIQPQALVE
jgi:hypothetical protein